MKTMKVTESVIDASLHDVQVPNRHFTGAVTQESIGELKPKETVGDLKPKETVGDLKPIGISVSLVHFYDGARTYLHTHPGGQILLILQGNAEVESVTTGIAKKLGPGDIVQFAPDEVHWHGAAPETDMTHLSIAFGETKWEDDPPPDRARL